MHWIVLSCLLTVTSGLRGPVRRPPAPAPPPRDNARDTLIRLDRALTDDQKESYYLHLRSSSRDFVVRQLRWRGPIFRFQPIERVLFKYNPNAWLALFDEGFPHWDSNRAMWVWVGWFYTHRRGGYSVTRERQMRLFWRAAEEGDLRILKFTVEEMKDLGFLQAYLQRYRLSQVVVDRDLSQLVTQLDARYFDVDLCKVLYLFFVDGWERHPFQASRFRVREGYPMSYNRTMLLASFLRSSRMELEVLKFPHNSTIEILAEFKALFSRYGIMHVNEMKQFDLQWKLVCTEDRHLVTPCFKQEIRSNVAKMSFLRYVHKRWPEWIPKHGPKRLDPTVKLSLAWKYPEYSYLLQPVKVGIERIIPPDQHFSFEKAEYLDRVIQLYGHEHLQQAMMARGDLYEWRDFYILGMVAYPHTPIDWCLMSKCLPPRAKDMEAWTLWLLRGREPNPEIITVTALDELQLFGLLFPKLRNGFDLANSMAKLSLNS